MKYDLLKILKYNTPDFVSGEQICQQLGVSRTAVWKQVKSLRSMGYTIEARSNTGYKLVSIPDLMYPQEITAEMKTSIIGQEIRHFTSVESTNKSAKKWAGDGAPEGSILVAEQQVTGKGRMGKSWFSPQSKGVWFSVILRPQLNIVDVSQITLLAAAAVSRGIHRNTGLITGIKWPNDLLASKNYSKKVCGILTEMNADMDHVNFVVLGVGLNVNVLENDIPCDLKNIITSLNIEIGKKIDRVNLLRNILEELDYWYKQWIVNGFTYILEEWKKRNVTIGRRVKIATINEVVKGKAEDITEKGALVVRLDNGITRQFMVGEVSLL
ncbi:MAG: biotin--[acetyl-CoA-carboxylase] ligase [Clostridiales bacterium]|nr:biotin--[acetyl-CoA-carboxylase] ligase [Clostridiales bacterium]MCF8023537.1 biotin--[acetyl-CoA-carboxylase] ligase [Clostridiales bacterium]